MGKARASHRVDGEREIKMRFGFCFPSPEALLNGWDAWEAHMLHINRRNVLAINKRGGYIVLANEDVFAMTPADVESLTRQAVACAPPQPTVSLAERIKGHWRYLVHGRTLSAYRRPA